MDSKFPTSWMIHLFDEQYWFQERQVLYLQFSYVLSFSHASQSKKSTTIIIFMNNLWQPKGKQELLIIHSHPLAKVSHNTKNRNCSIVTCTTVNQYSLVYVYMSVQCACYADALLIASSPITSGQYTYIHCGQI